MESHVFFVTEFEGSEMIKAIEEQANDLAKGRPWEITAMESTGYAGDSIKIKMYVAIKIFGQDPSVKEEEKPHDDTATF